MRRVSVTENPPVLRDANRRRLGHFQLRLLSVADGAQVLGLRALVLSRLEHPDQYVREADEEGFVRAHLAGHPGCLGETIGVFDGDTLVAYAMVALPDADDPHNLGRWLALPQRTTADVAHIASCMVRPDYRGHGLQRTLLAARFSLAQSRGRHVGIAMVSLHNHASRHNMMREGMRIAWAGEIDGLRRQLLAIDLGQAWRFDEAQACLAGALDWQRQCELTRQGWWGVSALEGPGPSQQLVFARHAVPPAPHDAAT